MNKWKVAFFSLLAFVLVTLCGAILLISMPFSSTDPTHPFTDELAELNDEDLATFTLTTKKKDINQLIYNYLKAENDEQGDDLEYRVWLEELVVIESKVSVFGTNVPLVMTFEPEVLDNGDIQLHQRSFHLGHMDLPVEMILQMMSHAVSFPEWVQVQPSEQQIYLGITQLQTEQGYGFKAIEFDLRDDYVEFDVFLFAE